MVIVSYENLLCIGIEILKYDYLVLTVYIL